MPRRTSSRAASVLAPTRPLCFRSGTRRPDCTHAAGATLAWQCAVKYLGLPGFFAGERRWDRGLSRRETRAMRARSPEGESRGASRGARLPLDPFPRPRPPTMRAHREGEVGDELLGLDADEGWSGRTPRAHLAKELPGAPARLGQGAREHRRPRGCAQRRTGRQPHKRRPHHLAEATAELWLALAWLVAVPATDACAAPGRGRDACEAGLGGAVRRCSARFWCDPRSCGWQVKR